MDPHGLWASGPMQAGCEASQQQQHQLLQHIQQQQQQAQLQQQQQAQLSIMLGQHGNHLAPLVGQQISQLSSMLPVGSSHQSPPALNMMLGGGPNMAALFQNHGGMGQVQSPPASQGGGPGGYLLLSTAAQHNQQRHAAEQQGGMPPALSPNSTPGIQMPAPPATPPIMSLDERMYLGGMGRMMQPGLDKYGMEQGMDEGPQAAMAWKGMQGGILADMFSSMDRQQMPQFHDPRLQAAAGQNMSQAQAMAQLQAQGQAYENLARLQQQQQQQQQHHHHQAQQQKHHHQQQQFHAMHGQPPHLYQQQEMRGYQHLMPAQSPPAPNMMQFHHGGPPGPRPRPVGGDDTSPGFTPEIPVSDGTAGESGGGGPKDDLVIGSWNEECEKEGGGGGSGGAACPPPQPPPNIPPPNLLHNMSHPPPNQPLRRSPNNNGEAFFGTFHAGGGNTGGGRGGGWGGGHGMGRKEEDDGGGGGGMYVSDHGARGRGMGGRSGDMDSERNEEMEMSMMRGGGGMRGRPLMRGGLPRGARGGSVRNVDINQEKANGKNAAIEETKALMAKMRLEEKEKMDRYKKEKGITDEDEGGEAGKSDATPTDIQPGAYRPREKRGRDDRKDGARARINAGMQPSRGGPRGGGGGGGGVGVGPRGGLPLHHLQPVGGLPNPLFGMPGHPGGHSEFRTPPFPGLEGFFANQALGGHFPPGFPPNLGPGFAPGMFPGGYPGTLRGGRGGVGFNRGPRGFPAGFPPRGFPPPLLSAGRGGGIGRGSVGGRGGNMSYQTGGGSTRGRDRGKNDGGDGGGGGGGSSGGGGATAAGGGDGNEPTPVQEENPLMSAINNTGKEAEKADAEANDANQPKNLFSEQGKYEGQLALLASADDLKARLSDQLVRGLTECMVCLERVKQTHATWDCHNCYQVFHIHCIKKWAKTARTEEGGWRCPGCQSVYPHIPRDYLCFCRKLCNPEWNRNEGVVPHSCGEVCGRRRAPPCPHTCVELCHAGPCPPCVATLPVICPCGKENRRMKCGEEFTCESECGKVLNCGAHTCPDPCHQGPCYDCHKKVEQACYCGKCVREVVCTAATAGVKVYSCGETCEKSRDCEQHQCDAACHPGPCQPCLLTPSRVTRCPCGKITLEQLYERDHVAPRTSCLDPVPTCGQTCGLRLQCGPPAQHHTCSALCHLGPCPVCPKTTSIRCRCGNMDKEISCCELTGHPDDARCEKRCQKKRSCGRHKCSQLCCTELDHICTQICGKQLSCGLHRCEELCHKGNCKTCPRVSFDELTCTCRAAVIYPPVACGTRPPECREMCTRNHACDHPVTHSCHSEDNCPPCTYLTAKMCFGGHEERKNVACLVEGLSCGKPCGKPLPCTRHSCIRICHAGPCIPTSPTHPPGAACIQPCTAGRPCGHPCNQPCHPPPCPDTTCSTQVRVTCECGHRQATISCSENSYARMTTALLATRMADVQAGNTVDLKELVRKDKKLECNEECSQLERNKRLALGLQIRNPELSSKIIPRYSEFMKDWAKKDPKFCAQIHDELTKLVMMAKESKQKSRSKNFDCMNREKRQLVHEYAEHFGCESESCDAEPKRNVMATAHRDKAWLPAISLVDLVQKQKKVPAPLTSSAAPSPVFTSLTKSATPPAQEKEVTKIDWFD